MTGRRISYATKFNSWDVSLRRTTAQKESKTSTGSTVRVSSPCFTHHGFFHPPSESFGDSFPSRGRIDTGLGEEWVRNDSIGYSMTQKLELQQPPAFNLERTAACPSCSFMVPGSPAVLCRTGESSLHNVKSPSVTTGAVLSRDLPVNPTEPVVSATNGDFVKVIKLVRDLVDYTASGEPSATILKSITHALCPELLRSLDAKQSSELLCLLGTASDNGSGCKYHSRLGGRIWSGMGINQYWEEVIGIAEEKEKMGHAFGEKECFWSMRAYLERSKLTGSSGALGGRDAFTLF